MQNLNNKEDISSDSNTQPPSNYLKTRTILIKYGGNAMKDSKLRQNIINDISSLIDAGNKIILVHGGGPEISSTLKMAGIETEFIAGHRKTTTNAMSYVEMALKGKVNAELVRLINTNGHKAVGISGKDGKTVVAKKRLHFDDATGKKYDLGQVGDISEINPDFISLLLNNGYIPIIAPIAIGEDGSDYNINADMFAGHLAAAINADDYMILTDVDGLMLDINNPDTLIKEISVNKIKNELKDIIVGGMLPKIESCYKALEGGVSKAHIINGTEQNILTKIIKNNEQKGTIIKLYE